MVWQTSEFGRHGHGGWSMHCSLRAISSINSYADFQTSHQGVKLRMELSAWKRRWATTTPTLWSLEFKTLKVGIGFSAWRHHLTPAAIQWYWTAKKDYALKAILTQKVQPITMNNRSIKRKEEALQHFSKVVLDLISSMRQKVWWNWGGKTYFFFAVNT